MSYQDRHTETIVECANKIRRIQENQIEPLVRIIQHELSVRFPSLDGKDSDGVVDWSCDIQGCSNDSEVIKTLNRIDSIENGSWKCSFCGKDTFDVDIDYLHGYNHLQCQLKNEMNYSTPSVEELKRQFDDILIRMKDIQSHIERMDSIHEEPTN